MVDASGRRSPRRPSPGGTAVTSREFAPARMALNGGSYSQTLSRGLQVLEVIAGSGRPMSAAELADVLQMHRSVIYRLVRTLEGHRLLTTELDGRYALGLGLLTLSRSVQYGLRSALHPILAQLSAELGETAIVGLVEGDEIVCIASVEPANGLLRVRYREGYRHSIELAAGGLAVLSALPPEPEERPEVAQAREVGYAVSFDELKEGAAAVSAPVLIPHQATRMSVTVLMPTGRLQDPDAVGQVVIGAAEQVAALF
jgi:DNA-binding IclR family transcriptional regulator